MLAPVPSKPAPLAPIDLDKIARAIEAAEDPRVLLELGAELDGAEQYMRHAGLYSTDAIRPIVESKLRARWKLGRLLAIVERGSGPGRGKKVSRPETSFRAYLRELGLQKDRASEAQRIGTMPDVELERAFVDAHKNDVLCTIPDLIDRARPYWYQASRKAKHQAIAGRAIEAHTPELVGPFPLIYADPPWTFEIYSEKGLERTPTQHYPTLTDRELERFKIGKRSMRQIAHRDAALFLWCTSSNLERALAILKAWGFTFKTSAVWIKDRAGLGLVFRNMHEVLLYGTRGKMPGPQFQPPSVFAFPRGEHSAKPPEIREAIERMYPDFNASTRLELFARETVDGWSSHGFEADRRGAGRAR